MFPVNIAKFLRIPVLKNICKLLLLYITFDPVKIVKQKESTIQDYLSACKYVASLIDFMALLYEDKKHRLCNKGEPSF